MRLDSTLLKDIIEVLLNNSHATISDIRRKTEYRFDSREISWVFKRLRRLQFVTYAQRTWHVNSTLLQSLGIVFLASTLTSNVRFDHITIDRIVNEIMLRGY